MNVKEVVELLKEIRDILKGQGVPEGIANSQPDAEPDPDAPDIMKAVKFLEELIGKSENEDYEFLMNLFEKYGIVTGDIRLDSEAWCGRILRAALVHAGFADPGPHFDRACHWEEIGEEEVPASDDPFDVPPGTVLVYYSHVTMKGRDNNELSGNVRNKVASSPCEQKWFGNPIAQRRIV